MDFELNDDQRAIHEAVEALLSKHAGIERATALGRDGDYDHPLETALDEAGFLDVALADGTGFLEAALVTAAVARAGGVAATGAAAIVAPGLLGRRLPGPVVLARASAGGLVRFAGHARSLLLDRGDDVLLVALEPGAANPVRTNFMIPVARLDLEALRGESLGADAVPRLHRFWRVALAAECTGLFEAALETTVEYVKQRRQFGRAIGSFQALQHRLAYCKVALESTRWLTWEAAAAGAPQRAAALAAGQAADAASQLFAETHQITGAMGYTREHPLHVFSMRLRPLLLELGGAPEHYRVAADAPAASE